MTLCKPIPATMSGVVFTGHGGLDKLEWRDNLLVPKPGPGEDLIRVQAASVCRPSSMACQDAVTTSRIDSSACISRQVR